jgi:hypothetical protein
MKLGALHTRGRDHETGLTATSAYSASIVVRKHYGFISTVIVFGWTISDQRLNRSNLDTEDGVAGEPSAPGGLHVSFDVR